MDGSIGILFNYNMFNAYIIKELMFILLKTLALDALLKMYNETCKIMCGEVTHT
jgi:hypothetical protein